MIVLISRLSFQAADGSLTIMPGRTLSEFQKAKPYLDTMIKYILYCEYCVKYQLVKAFNNIVYGINIAAKSEIMQLAMKLGLDPNVLEQLFTPGSSRSFASEYSVPRMTERTFTGDYSLKGALKDITNVQQAIS